MQQSTAEQPMPAPRVRFGVELQATKAEYRQALWGFPAIVVPGPSEVLRPAGVADETQQTAAERVSGTECAFIVRL